MLQPYMIIVDSGDCQFLKPQRPEFLAPTFIPVMDNLFVVTNLSKLDRNWFMIYHFIVIYKMIQFMDESFTVTVRLSKETGYKYNITVMIVYNDKQSICYKYIEIGLEHISNFKTNFLIVEKLAKYNYFRGFIAFQKRNDTPIFLCVNWETYIIIPLCYQFLTQGWRCIVWLFYSKLYAIFVWR